MSCATRLLESQRYPVGTKFKIWATLTSREGRGKYLYSHPMDAVITVTDQEAREFINGLKKDHI